MPVILPTKLLKHVKQKRQRNLDRQHHELSVPSVAPLRRASIMFVSSVMTSGQQQEVVLASQKTPPCNGVRFMLLGSGFVEDVLIGLGLRELAFLALGSSAPVDRYRALNIL